MSRPKLKAALRKILGKKVKKIRKEGFLPANLYGKKVKSQTLQVSYADFEKIHKTVGETGLIDLIIDKEAKVKPVLIHNVQLHPVTSYILHADFHQVALKEKTKAEISLVIKGESPAILQKKGLLIQPLNKVEIEALPTDLPEEIEVDISKLEEIDQEIKVGDLIFDKKITVLTDKNVIVAKIGPLEEEKAEEKEVEKEQEEEAVSETAEEEKTIKDKEERKEKKEEEKQEKQEKPKDSQKS